VGDYLQFQKYHFSVKVWSGMMLYGLKVGL